MKLVTTKFKSGGLHEKHVMATTCYRILLITKIQIILTSDYPDAVYHFLSDTRFLNELARTPKSNSRTLSVMVIANSFFLPVL